MIRKNVFTSFCLAFLMCFLSFYFLAGARAEAQAESRARVLISQSIDESELATLKGNLRPEVNPENDSGPVTDGLRMEHMLLQLQRPPELEKELQQFIDELHNPASPDFHKWLTAQQFGERFGLAQQDLETITHWLEAHGFTVNVVYPSGMLIDFSGTAAQVRAAFHTEIHNLKVNGTNHIANMRNPQIPAALAPAVLGIVSLHDFRPHPMHKMRAPPNYTFGSLFGNNYAIVPADLATIYNLNPLFSSGFSGQGQTIVVIEDTNVYSTADWTTFRSTFGLSNYPSGSFTQVHPAPAGGANNCRNPGVLAPNDAEAILDAEYASAVAPSAAIELASCADTSATFGGLIAIQNLINANTTPPAVISISYGECEAMNGTTANAAYNSAYQQAVTEGVSVFVAAGDSGAAGCDNGASQATHGIGVNAFASTAYDVAVGGTDYSDTYSNTNSAYWSSTDTSTFGSAISYIPEIPWNDSCAGMLLANYEGYSTTYGPSGFCSSFLGGYFQSTASGGGGPSACTTGTPTVSGVVSGTCQGWPKPPWQSVLGNPSDAVRDTPDISLFAADGLWNHYYVFCWSDTAHGGASCTGAPSGWSGGGGTSFASPIMAGIQALVNQKTGERQGNPNPVYYQLAATEYAPSGSNSCNSSNGNGVGSTCIFYDITQGDMDVGCAGNYDCYLPSGTGGVLSTSNGSYSPAYGTTTGWDFATGIGSVNATNLANDWPTPSNSAVLSITKVHTGNFTQGQQNATYTVTVSNRTNAAPTSGTVTVTETAPSGLTLVSMTGAGWTCAANNCMRSDALNGGGSYPPITVTVNVAANASSPQVNQVSLSGSGSGSASASDSTTIMPPPAVATFVGADTTTKGNWHGVYGADGYSVANDSQVIPSYASFAVQNQANWTWAASTTDVRALQNGANTGRIAATWYNSASFSFDVNFKDGNAHQFAFYAVDWDSTARAETIQILDANTSAVLDTRSISSFSNGMYLVWNISGHAKINVTRTAGNNAVVSGVFFGGGSETVTVTPQTLNLSAGQQQQFTAIVINASNQSVTWSIGTVNPTNAASGTISPTGLYTAPTTTAQVTIKATSADGSAFGTSTVNVTVPAVATFVGADTTTKGNWHGVYGADGYSVANDSQSIPSYASFAVQNQSNWTWAASTTDVRALQNGANTGRIAATWYKSGTFTFDVNLKDGNLHQLALYAVDWDSTARAETIQILDANTSAVLDTRSISSFSNGMYLVWNISGHAKINITRTAGNNAVVSGVFFR